MGENLKVSNQFLSYICLNHQMKRLVFVSLVTAFSLFNAGLATAHQPVELGSKNTRADQGPILVDGTISFALRANFTKANQERGFRASLKQGELLNFEYLIIDKAPENKMALNKLPTVTITAPDGTKSIIKFTERTKFYEPYGRTNYLYLSRFSSTALDGIYNFSIKSKAKASITVSTGSRETFGQVFQPSICPSIEQQQTLTVTNAQAATLIGMKKDAAASCASKLSWGYRVGQEDDQLFALTKDYRLDRVTVVIKNGLITQSIVG
jgi:hypothetical protein